MKWKEMSIFQRVIFVIGFLSVVVYLILSVLNFMDVLDVNAIANIVFCVFFLSQGIRYWDTRRKWAIFSFILTGLIFLLSIADLFI